MVSRTFSGISFSDDVYIVYTDKILPVDHVVVTTRYPFLVFTVDGCTNAHLYLTHHPEVTNSQAYLISIGISNNKQTSVQKMAPNTDLRTFDTDGILLCGGTQALWIDWTSGHFSFGVGFEIGQDRRFEWIDSQPYAINSFLLASTDDNPIKWTFPRGYGESATCQFLIYLHYVSCLALKSSRTRVIFNISNFKTKNRTFILVIGSD